MIYTAYVNHHLQGYLKKCIRNNPIYFAKLKHLLYCGAVATDRYGGNGVSVISNGNRAKIVGARMCRQSWACPVCAAREMSAYATKVDCVIKSLASKRLVPIMITFTIFHTISESLEKTFGILRRAYTLFTKNANWKRRKADGGYYEAGGVWSNFIKEFNIRHYIKASEITYGTHGWHPHLHCLFFVPENRLQDVAEWELKLRKSWRAKEETAYNAAFDGDQTAIHTFLYGKHDKANSETVGLYISKTKDGKIMKMDTGSYICGWGGTSELTASAQKTCKHEGHYQLHELLEQACFQNNEKLLHKYLDFCMYAIKEKLHRIEFSRSGLNQLVKTYQQTESFKEYLKKKHTPEVPYKTVAWFTSNQWKQITCSESYFAPLLLIFATYQNGYELICELCTSLGYQIPAPRSIKFDAAEFFNRYVPPAKKDITAVLQQLA